MRSAQSAPSAGVLSEAQTFVYHEARLLDEQRLEEWLALFAADGCYWMPATWNQPDPLDYLSLYHEDVNLLDVRVRRIRHPRTETMKPPPRTAHLMSNIMVDSVDEGTGEMQVYSTFSLFEYRLNEQRVFAGHVRHRLRRTPEGLKIVLKRVDLLNCDTECGHLRFNIPI